MKLTQKVLLAIHNPSVRRELTVALKCTDQTIIRYIKGNEDNGELTKAAALKVIREVTELSDQEILEAEEEVVTK